MIELKAIAARAGRFELRNVSFSLAANSWSVLLGPAGAGKTTLLEVIAGIRRINSGRLILRDTDATDVPPEDRRVGMVYQHAFLFPHLSVWRNVKYGGSSTSAEGAVALLGIGDLMSRDTMRLSGGERQLVALARALAATPDILLLDEPFAALDPARRVRVRAALRRLQREERMTVLQVTHDLVEAGLLGDLALVLEEGELRQAAPPEELFRAPASASIASFVGIENVFRGTVVPASAAGEDEEASLTFTGDGLVLHSVGRRQAGPAHAVVRAQDVTLHDDPPASSARNVFSGVVAEVAPDGVLARVTIEVGDAQLVALITRSSVMEMGLDVGHAVSASVKATNVHIC